MVVVVVDVEDVVVDEVVVDEVVVDSVVVAASDVAMTADVVAFDESAASPIGSIADAWLQAVANRQPPSSNAVRVALTADTLQTTPLDKHLFRSCSPMVTPVPGTGVIGQDS